MTVGTQDSLNDLQYNEMEDFIFVLQIDNGIH